MKRVTGIVLLLGLICAAVWGEPTYPDGWVYDVESNWTNWRDHTYALPILTHEGGDPDNNTYFTAHARGKPEGGQSNWFYPYDSGAGGTNGALVGNLWEKYGDRFIFTVDVKVETAGFTLDQVYFDFYGADGGRFDETFWSVNQTAADGWVTYTIGFDSSWTTDDAIANGWNNRGSNDFYDTYAGMSKIQFVGGKSAVGDPTEFQISVDNWGFLPVVDPVPEPNAFVVTFEPDQQSAWLWMKDGTHTAIDGTEDLVSGGNPGLAMPSNTSAFPYIYFTNNSGAGKTMFHGNLFDKYGDRMVFTADVKVTSDVDVQNFYVSIPGWTEGPWLYFWPGPFDPNEWVTLTAPIDAFWKDDQAQLNLWYFKPGFSPTYNPNGSNFNGTIANVNGASLTIGARPGLSGGSPIPFRFALDNIGFRQVPRPAPVENKGFICLFQHQDDHSIWRCNGDIHYPGRLETSNSEYDGIGGNPGGCIELTRSDAGNLTLSPLESKWSSDYDATDAVFENDLFGKYGDQIEFVVDVRVMTDGVTVTEFSYTHVGDATRDMSDPEQFPLGIPNGDWTYTWTGSWTSADGWISLRAPMDAAWSDVQAGQHGWTSNGTDSFVDTISNTFMWTQISVSEYSPDAAGITVRVDNYGYKSRLCGDIDHLYPDHDLNEDCRVDLADLAVVTDGWGGTYGIEDLSILGNAWLSDVRPDLD